MEQAGSHRPINEAGFTPKAHCPARPPWRGFLCSRGRALDDDEKGSHNLRTPGSRRAVMMLLSDEEWSNWSNREIARCCAVNLDLVNRIRNTSSLNDSVSERTYTTKQCTVATMNTSAIGPRRR
jgi:hypothetical protein